MIVIDNLMQVANQIETERGVTKEVLFSAIEQAIVAACKRRFKEEVKLDAILNNETGEVKIYRVFDVVEEVEIPESEVTEDETEAYGSKAKVGEIVQEIIELPDFGRIAAQTAKQVIIQRIREAEKESVYDEFIQKVGTIITGTVQRVENRNYLINLGRTEAILPFREQIPGEIFDVKEKLKLYVVDIEKGPRGNTIRISRTHPGLLESLFKLEIPEIQDEIIEIKAVSREPGKRSKVAVKSNNPSIGAVGTCVGQMGGRIQSIIKELANEKIDVLEWDENPNNFISNALKPAKISQVIITDEEERVASVIVPNDQLSLAIGKAGINVRLSVKLTGWKLDIVSEEDYNQNGIESAKPKLSLLERMQLDKDKTLAEEAAENADVDNETTETETVTEEKEEVAINSESTDDAAEVKVSLLAKELGIKTADLIEKAAEKGIEIKSNRSLVTSEDAAKLRETVTA